MQKGRLIQGLVIAIQVARTYYRGGTSQLFTYSDFKNFMLNL